MQRNRLDNERRGSQALAKPVAHRFARATPPPEVPVGSEIGPLCGIDPNSSTAESLEIVNIPLLLRAKSWPAGDSRQLDGNGSYVTRKSVPEVRAGRKTGPVCGVDLTGSMAKSPQIVSIPHRTELGQQDSIHHTDQDLRLITESCLDRQLRILNT